MSSNCRITCEACMYLCAIAEYFSNLVSVFMSSMAEMVMCFLQCMSRARAILIANRLYRSYHKVLD